MDLSTDIWGQLAVEASQVYLSDGTVRSPFADTVCSFFTKNVKKMCQVHKNIKIIFVFYKI